MTETIHHCQYEEHCWNYLIQEAKEKGKPCASTFSDVLECFMDKEQMEEERKKAEDERNKVYCIHDPSKTVEEAYLFNTQHPYPWNTCDRCACYRFCTNRIIDNERRELREAKVVG